MILPASARRPCCSKQQFMKSRRSKHTLALRIAFGMNETWPRNCRCRRREIWPARPAGLFRGVCYRRMLPPSRRQLSPFDHMVRNSANRKLVVPLESWIILNHVVKGSLSFGFFCIVRGETSASYGEKQPFRFLIGASTDISLYPVLAGSELCSTNQKRIEYGCLDPSA